MSGETVYDLGDLDAVFEQQKNLAAPESRNASAPASKPSLDVGSDPRIRVTRTYRKPARPWAWQATLSIVAPGAGQLASDRRDVGVGFVTAIGFTAALVWAIQETLGRLVPTFEVLGLPGESASWILGGVMALGAILHVVAVVDAGYGQGVVRPVAPALAGTASALVPGFGQVLNGHWWRAAGFLAGVWLVVASWVLASPWLATLLDANGMILPPLLDRVATPAVRAGLAVVVWVLAVYDAVLAAAHRRR